MSRSGCNRGDDGYAALRAILIIAMTVVLAAAVTPNPHWSLKSVWRAYFGDARAGRVWLVVGKNCFIRSGLSCKREITRLI